MQNEKLQVNLNGENPSELLIREVTYVNELPVKAPVKIALSGTLASVFEFLMKRMYSNQINPLTCHIVIRREDISILLVFNESDHYNSGMVEGKLELHPAFRKFGINEGLSWTPTELGFFIKMNRAFFQDTDVCMKLVNTLMNFSATINNKIDRAVSESGSKTDNFSQVVNSNLPEKFALQIPIFKGGEKEIIEVETFAKVNGREVSFVLISPGAQELTEHLRDKAIDEQKNMISDMFPEIVIIEQ